MIDAGKHNVAGVLVDAVDYEGATARVMAAAREPRPLSVTSMAVHGLIECVSDDDMRYRFNHLDIVTADGQPVRWALRLLHGIRLPERTYGPTLMLHVCQAAAQEGTPVYFYGSQPEVVERLSENLTARYPGLVVAGATPSTFRRVSPAELDAIAAEIRASGARIVFVGLGCPRQEVFVHECRDRLGVPVMGMGAAFDYHSGFLQEPPMWMQRWGLQWAWRLWQEPGRLWRRYLSTNPRFVVLVALQRLGLWRSDPEGPQPPATEIGYA